MPDKNLRLLILDDSPEDRTVVRFMLEEAPGRAWQFLEEDKGSAALHRLENEEVDCILLDHHLPDMNAIRFLSELSQRFGPLRFPVVVFTGLGSSSLADRVLLAGAQDLLSKDMIRLDTLTRAIGNAIRHVHLLRERQTQREQLHALKGRLNTLEAALREVCAPVVITEVQGREPWPRTVFVNPAFTTLTGHSEADVIGRTSKVLLSPKTRRDLLARMRRELISRRLFSGQVIHRRKDGGEVMIDVSISPVQDSRGRTTHFVVSQRMGIGDEESSPDEQRERSTPTTHTRSKEGMLFRSSLAVKCGAA